MNRTLKTMALTGLAVLLSGGLALAAEKTDPVKSKSSRAQQSVTVSVAGPTEFDGNQDLFVLPVDPDPTPRLRYDPSRKVPRRSDDRPDCDDLSLFGAVAQALGLLDLEPICTP